MMSEEAVNRMSVGLVVAYAAVGIVFAFALPHFAGSQYRSKAAEKDRSFQQKTIKAGTMSSNFVGSKPATTRPYFQANPFRGRSAVVTLSSLGWGEATVAPAVEENEDIEEMVPVFIEGAAGAIVNSLRRRSLDYPDLSRALGHRTIVTYSVHQVSEDEADFALGRCWRVVVVLNADYNIHIFLGKQGRLESWVKLWWADGSCQKE